MIDKSREDAKRRDPLPAFLPVPRQCARHDGWTPERQRDFIEALADTGSVRAAANAVNMAPEGAYLLRRHPEGGEFRKAWERALKLGVQRLEDVAMDRALNGVESPVYHFGEIIGTRRVYNDRLLMFILRNRAGKRFNAEGRHDATTRGELRKLKARWKKEWERERAIADNAAQSEERDELGDLLESRHLQWWAGLSPRTRDAYRTFRRYEQEDGRVGWLDEEVPAICDDYEATFGDDRRPPISRYAETEGIGGDHLHDPDQEDAHWHDEDKPDGEEEQGDEED